jgi:hypothetical protein
MKALRFILLLALAASIAAPAFGPVLAADVLPPLPPSPIGEFRQWLTNSAARQVALAKRSEKSRRTLEQKLEEYNSMPDEERNRRLDSMESMEIRFYLRPMMEQAPEQRDLRKVPVILQPMVETRLEQWDKLRPALRREALDHELMLQYVSAPTPRQAAVLRAMPPEERQRLEQRVAQWTTLSAEEREKIEDRLGQFFRMAPAKQERALHNFPPKERLEMNNTLQVFSSLAPQEREQCLQSFTKFASMKADEQLAFLKNAERWQAMPPKDRETWREIVKSVPPMPPMPSLGGDDAPMPGK